jgi:carbon starvation protein CstA
VKTKESYKEKSIKYGKLCSWTVIVNSCVLIFYIYFKSELPKWLLLQLAAIEGLALIVSLIAAIICVVTASWDAEIEKED